MCQGVPTLHCTAESAQTTASLNPWKRLKANPRSGAQPALQTGPALCRCADAAGGRRADCRAEPGAKLVDVRTRAEWEWVGRVPETVLIEWNGWPGGARNAEFERELLAKRPRQGPLRSSSSAAAAGGRITPRSPQRNSATRTAFNVLEGFEGDKDASGHRGTVGGWKFAGLPWVQG